jgi:glycosyltransferase involved in cell wall biosynthesis
VDWPSLSILIPSFNQGRYLERTLLSIIKQEYAGRLEIVVSDGGSTDETVGVLKRYPEVRWWSEPDQGFVDAVTKALAVASGEVLAIQSSDDYYLEGAFRTAIPVLVQDASLGFVSGAEMQINISNELTVVERKPSSVLDSPEDLILGVYVPQHCTFIRRAALDTVGGLRMAVDRCADFDLWYRVLHFFHGQMLSSHLAVYQLHPAQRTQTQAENWIRCLDMVIETCAGEPSYAERFLLDPEKKRNFMKRMEMHWFRTAGGREGLRKSRTLAADVWAHPEQWSQATCDAAGWHLSVGLSEDEPAPDAKRTGIINHPYLRRLLGKPLRRQKDIPQETLDLNTDADIHWWRKNPDLPAADASVIPVSMP